MFTDAVEYFNLAGSGGDGPAPGTYRIVNRNSGKPLAVAGNSTADGAKVVQQSGTATWTIATTSDGSYTLQNVASATPNTCICSPNWTATGSLAGFAPRSSQPDQPSPHVQTFE